MAALPPVRLADGRELPGDLPALLGSMQEVPAQAVIGRLLRVPVCGTRTLMEIPMAQWRGADGACYVTGCAGLREPLARYLRSQWGVGLGELAPIAAPARGRERERQMTMLERYQQMCDAPTVIDVEPIEKPV
jgi:hypothetical protein